MLMRKVRLTLIKEDAFLTNEQQKDIAEVINSYDWSGITELIEINSFTITDKYIQLKVEEKSNKWHNPFSQVICNRAKLREHVVEIGDGTRLFDPSDVN